MKKAYTIIITNNCDARPRCDGCPALCNRFCGVDRKTVLDVEQCIRWFAEFAPGCDVHVEGGEPLIVPDIESKIQMLIDAGHRVTLLTNALKIKEHTALFDMPIGWHIGHKSRQYPIDEFLIDIAPIKSRPHLITRVHGTQSDPFGSISAEDIQKYVDAGFNFAAISNHRSYDDWEHGQVGNPNDLIGLIGLKGEVYNCSFGDKHHIIGNVYEMTNNPTPGWTCRSNFCGVGKCQALATAERMYSLWEKWESEQ